MDIDKSVLSGKKVLVTGHTGFKGSWLSMTLKLLGAEVHGISLPVPKSRMLYKDSDLNEIFETEYFLDIRNREMLEQAIKKISPDYTFHLAAQALVTEAFENPYETFDVNIIGTLNVLHSIQKTCNSKGICIATTDKVYKNENKQIRFLEHDPLGNSDPYSASKAAAEIVIESIASIQSKDFIPISTVRAGNVIGGGDWAAKRLIPDIVRSIESNVDLKIRYPLATRPWQHVMDCIWGYILVAERQLLGKQLEKISSFNFGPDVSMSVNQVVSIFEKSWGTSLKIIATEDKIYEKTELLLDSSKAKAVLGWKINFESESAIKAVAQEYREMCNGEDIRALLTARVIQFLTKDVKRQTVQKLE